MYEIAQATPKTLKQSIEIWKNRMVEKLKEIPTIFWIAPILLTILLGYNIYDSRQKDAIIKEQTQNIAQIHDLVLTLKVQKDEQDRVNERDRHEFMVQIKEQETWREVLNNKINELKYSKQGGNNNHAAKEQ